MTVASNEAETMSACAVCGESYDPQLSNGSDVGQCQDCFDVYLDCKTCGECFGNDFNDPVDNCPECSAVEKLKAETPTASQIQQELNAYMLSLIGGGFNAEAYKEYGVNAAQTTYVARLICWHARASGSFAADLDGISASVIGHPMDGLMSYTLGDEDVALFDWLDAITEMLAVRFDGLFSERSA